MFFTLTDRASTIPRSIGGCNQISGLLGRKISSSNESMNMHTLDVVYGMTLGCKVTVDNRVPWAISRRGKGRGTRQSRNIVWHSLTTDGSQRARLPIPLKHCFHPFCVAKDLA